MVNKIQILENNLINKIAAGEVIERPASIVKELIENSLDAKAKNIKIEIKNGGIDYIKIQDDGIGIEKDQIKTAFLRHATSKLTKIDDLDSILTLGFRGEALSSIASISRVEMITKTKNCEVGSKIVVEGGNIISESEVATLEGTIFTIRDIFFNTPARRKFLKKNSVEGGHISDIINKLALGHKDVSFSYINNGLEILKTYADNNIKNTALQVYGKSISEKLLPLNTKKDGFILEGLVGLPSISRGNRSYANFFINGRYIKSKIVSSAIEDSYDGKLMTGKFPVFIINLSVPENTVDVNVHPTKLEVRFENETFIYDFIRSSVTECLSKEILIPTADIKKPKFSNVSSSQSEVYTVEKQPSLYENSESTYLEKLLVEDEQEYNFGNKKIKLSEILKANMEYSNCDNMFYNMKPLESEISLNEVSPAELPIKTNQISEDKQNIKILDIKKDISQTKNTRDIFFKNYTIVGQIFSTYWIVEQKNEIYLIDQHSAHERIIYDKLYEKYKSSNVSSQKLLVPMIFNVSPLEKVTIQENLDLFKVLGFEIEDFGLDTYAIRSVPFIFNGDVSPSYFVDILDAISEKSISSIYDLKVEKIILISCKKAVKANDTLSKLEAKALIDEMLKSENPFHCPHGRPTITKLTKSEIEKMFGRR